MGLPVVYIVYRTILTYQNNAEQVFGIKSVDLMVLEIDISRMRYIDYEREREREREREKRERERVRMINSE